ncbi:DUF1294 domain-containing protein [Flavobacterium cerinum]|uniref:DUF1294 domain-containing protein n=1 Tax=Flavobacterium cerinum TaxID=2502784 RepID=A0ABY5IX26_9FLAO|nr:DUF1294 domain-containing protein [Flavobacterium cerinum]UUC46293.1 DUF1294 domain-containing protein [Flavobacterium cerinum]
MNIIVFVVFGTDKWLAVTRKNRISEKTLLIISFLGGSVGAIIAMLLFRHKTSKSSFLWKFTILLVLQIGILMLLKQYSDH